MNIYINVDIFKKNCKKIYEENKRDFVSVAEEFYRISAISIDFSAKRLYSEKLRFHTLHIPEMHM